MHNKRERARYGNAKKTYAFATASANSSGSNDKLNKRRISDAKMCVSSHPGTLTNRQDAVLSKTIKSFAGTSLVYAEGNAHWAIGIETPFNETLTAIVRAREAAFGSD